LPPRIAELCLPYAEGPSGWHSNATAGFNCVSATRSAVTTAYTPLVCQHDFAGQQPTLSDTDYQACLAANRPLSTATFTTIQAAAASFDELSAALPKIQDILQCRFINDAFLAIVEGDCPTVEEATQRVWHFALVAAIGLTAASFSFCLCIQCASDYSAAVLAVPLTKCCCRGIVATRLAWPFFLPISSVMQKLAAAARQGRRLLHRATTITPVHWQKGQTAKWLLGRQGWRARAASRHGGQCTDWSDDVHVMSKHRNFRRTCTGHAPLCLCRRRSCSAPDHLYAQVALAEMRAPHSAWHFCATSLVLRDLLRPSGYEITVTNVDIGVGLGSGHRQHCISLCAQVPEVMPCLQAHLYRRPCGRLM
jgi:hypothetical protein